MKVDSLDELGAAFAAWRKRKKYAREAVPDELLARAQRAAKRHGVRAVARVTRFESARLFRTQAGKKAAQGSKRGEAESPPSSAPGFTRLELNAPQARGPRPFAEIETAAGVKLRVFEGSPEVIGFISTLCRSGGA